MAATKGGAVAQAGKLPAFGWAGAAVRPNQVADGAKFTEELVSYNTASRTYQYRIIGSPLPITDYVSTLEIRQNRAASTVVWSSNFKVNTERRLHRPCAARSTIRRPPQPQHVS